jgi:TPR repeat protein
LGELYYFGLGVDKDYEKAAEWYQKAALQGDADAQYKLGVCYYYGHGTSQDHTKAVEWLQKAADQGQEDAQKKLNDGQDAAKE